MTQGVNRPDRLSATLALDGPTTDVPGVKAARSKALADMGIHTVRDLLEHFPRRYLDLTQVRTSATARIGERCTMAGIVHEVKLKRPRRNLSIVEITLTDDDGAFIVSVFHRAYLAEQLSKGQKLIVAGKTEFNYGFLRMTNPYIEPYESGDVRGKVIPVHGATSKISAAVMRNIVAHAIDETEGILDALPANIRQRRDLPSRQCAIRSIHFPSDMGEAARARTRLAYEELLYLQLFMMMEAQRRNASVTPYKHVVSGKLQARLRKALPFTLTKEQEQAVSDLLASLSEDSPTTTMLLGDVGTGKTMVSAFGMAAAADSGMQAMLLAPTEVLASQHSSKLGPILQEAGVSCRLLTGSTDGDERARILSDFGSGEVDVLIGTHALLEPDVKGKEVSFVVIDEQQRFGVEQRETILSKAPGADTLLMTATPIPRTLALTLFGDMRLSYIHEKPNAERKVVTKALDYKHKGVAFDAALAALREGRQVYIVCPLIEPGDGKKDAEGNDAEEEGPYFDDLLIEGDEDYEKGPLSSAAREAEMLSARVFGEYEVGLMHGQLAAEEKAGVMKRFHEGEIDVLVSTTVIEVGVDVPNASVMIVENADRFGLSQLHQLRGRVGRGEHDGQAFLISSTRRMEAMRRLQALERSDDGFEIARYDLSLRREGDILGNRQSGASTLKVVNIMRDADLIEAAHDDASRLLSEDPGLELKEHAALAREVRMAFVGEHSRLGG